MNDDLYETLASGGTAEVPPSALGTLRRSALAAARSKDAEARLAVLRVTPHLARPDAVRALSALVGDADEHVRRWVLLQTLALGEAGLGVLQAIASTSFDDDVVVALRHLTRAADRSALSTGRRALTSGSPDVRAAAAKLVGRVAGPSARPALSRLLDDPETSVRSAVEEAIDELDSAPPAAESWFTDGVLPTPPIPTPRSESTPEPEPPAEPPPEAEAAPRPTADDDAETSAEPGGDAPKADAAPAQAADDAASLAQDEAQAEGHPQALPSSTRPLLAHLGACAASDRAVVLAALEEHPAEDIGAILAAGDGGHRDLALGLALAAAAFGTPSWVGAARRLSGHADPDVRAASAIALGELGGASVMPALLQALSDEVAAVRRAAVAATASLCRRIDRPDLLERAVSPLAGDSDPVVVTAVEEVLGS